MGVLSTIRQWLAGPRAISANPKAVRAANRAATEAQKAPVSPMRKVWARAVTPNTVQPSTGIAGGRVSWDNQSFQVTSGGWASVVPPPDSDSDWRLLHLDRSTLDTINPAELQRFLIDLSPEISKALWDWLRFMNPGYEIYVVKPGTEDRDAAASDKLTAILKPLEDRYVTLDIPINRLHMAQFIRGALLTEAVFAKDRRTLLDLATPDPAYIRFRREIDAETGGVKYVLCQWQNGRLIDLPTVTVKYLPIDPAPASPYGRAPVAPAMFASLFLLSMLRDLKRVVQQQGYPRIDVVLLIDKLQAMMPDDLADDPEELKKWVQTATDEVANAFAALEPDDAYVHGDAIQVNRPVGAVDASALDGTDALIRGLERMAVRALKSAAFLLGSQESTTETQAIRQYEAYAQSIRTAQHMSESLLSYNFTLALNANGVMGDVRVQFAENRASEEARDASVRQAKQTYSIEAYWMGYTSFDEASLEATGHEPDAQKPRLDSSAYGFVDAAKAQKAASANAKTAADAAAAAAKTTAPPDAGAAQAASDTAAADAGEPPKDATKTDKSATKAQLTRTRSLLNPDQPIEITGADRDALATRWDAVFAEQRARGLLRARLVP